MTANTSPVFPLKPIMTLGALLQTANTAKDGTGVVGTIYTAGSDGSKMNGVQVAYTGTSVQTVLRIFANNGGSNAVAANNSLLMSVTIPANTLSETTAANDIFIPLAFTLPGSYKLLATIGTTVAAALAVTGIGADLS